MFVMNVINLDYSALYSILLLAFVLFSFAFTDFIGGNGYLAVYISGLVVGNNPMIHKKSVVTFFDGLTWLFQIIMFLVLGLLATPSELLKVWKPAVAIGIFMIVAARPLTVFLCLLPFRKFNIKSKSFISWVGLRGAVPIIFATYPCVANVPHADTMFNIVFFITIISLVLQGTTVPLSAKVLGLIKEPENLKNFSVELPEDIAIAAEFKPDEAFLSKYKKAGDIDFNDGVGLMMARRGDNFFIPNKNTVLKQDDKLLIIASNEEDIEDFCSKVGIEKYEIYKN